MNNPQFLTFIVLFLMAVNLLVWLFKSTLTKEFIAPFIEWWKNASHLIRIGASVVFLTLFVYGSTKTNQMPQSPSAPLIEQISMLLSGTIPESGLNIEWDDPANAESLPELTSNQCAAGLALVSISTNPAPAFWAMDDLPSNMVALVNPAWLKYGIAEDGYWINSTNSSGEKEWSFRIGGEEVESVFIANTGTVSMDVPVGSSTPRMMPDESGLSILAPLWGPVGVVPGLGSRVWSAATTNQSLLVVWQDVLINRLTNSADRASFQSELCWNSDVIFRYNFLPEFSTSNHIVGVQHAGGGESATLDGTNSALQVNAFELFWRGFTPFTKLPGDDDFDDDGLTDAEEVRLHGTSPTLADSDRDGLSDSNEVANASNPLNPDTDGDSIADSLDSQVTEYNDPSAIDPVDGYTNGWKAANGLLGVDCSIDSDNDGYMDWMEAMVGTDPEDASDVPAEGQNDCTLTDITITLGYDLPAPVLVSIGERRIMIHHAGSWSVTLPRGIAYEVSVYATKPCYLMLGAALSSNRALLLDSSGIFTVSHPAGVWTTASMMASPFTLMSMICPAGAVYVTGELACGIFARPLVEIQTSLFCFHSSSPKSVMAVVQPELEGVYQWSWIDDDCISSPTGRETSIMWDGPGSSSNLEISFLAEGTVEPASDSRTIYKCSHADDTESADDDDDYDPQPHDDWCHVHARWISVCHNLNLDPEDCAVTNSESDPESGLPVNAGDPIAVNNDDDDGDGILDLSDTDGVTGDVDFIKIYPFSPYTGGCCPCPSHNPSASTTVTRLSCSANLSTWGDAAKTTQCTSVGRGDAVYVEATGASTYIGGDKIVWTWTEDSESHARTNTYTIFSLRMFGDLNFDNSINSNDYAGVKNLTEHGWIMPVASNAFRKVLLKNDVNFSGDFILSLSGDAGIRVWTTATPSTNDIPLLITGQTVTNGVDGVSFVSYPESMIYVEAIDSGTATLSYNYVGTGEHATGLECKATLMISAVQINFSTNRHYSCLSCPEIHTISLSSSSYTPNGAIWSILPDLSGGASITSVASDYLSAVIDPGGIRTNYTIVVENSSVSEYQDCIELIVGAYEWKDVGLLYDNPDFGVINYNTHLSPQYPAPNVYKVEEGQNMIFRVTIDDKDIRRQMCDICNQSWKGTVENCDDYRIDFINSGFGSFNENQIVYSKSIDGKDSGVVYFYSLTNFNWQAGSTQTVSAVLYDCNTNAVVSPDTGSSVDDPVTVTWLFTKSDYTPHHLSLFNGATSWTLVQAMYIYNVLPDPNNTPPGNQPYFESYIFGESFTHVDPEFTMNDIDSAWLYDPNYPERSSFYTATDVARHLWPGPGGSNDDGNGTFSVNADDRITDLNSAHVYTEPFTAMALTNGVGFSCKQSFMFGTDVLGTSDLTFKRFATNITTSVLKTIPQ